MPRLDEASGGQRWGLATLGDRAGDVWRQEGEMHEMSDATKGEGVASEAWALTRLALALSLRLTASKIARSMIAGCWPG